MILDTHIFLDGNSTETVSSAYRVANLAGTLMLHVEGAVSGVTVEAQADQGVTEWFPVAAIAMKDFAVKQEIDAEGIYNIGLSGLQFIRVVNSGAAGSVSVTGTITD